MLIKIEGLWKNGIKSTPFFHSPIALIMGIDRILDMSRTAVNITGDAVCTTIVASQDGSLDRDVFYATETAREGE